MRRLLSIPLFKTANGIIALATALQKLGFMVTFGRKWRIQRERYYGQTIVQLNFNKSQGRTVT